MTLAELSTKYGVHPTQIGTWKRTAIENMATTFTRKGSAPEQVSVADIDKLHSQIGQLVVERDFLADASRQMARHMKRNNHKCGRHRVRRLMWLMRLVPIYQKPNTSKKHPQHKIWSYLLRNAVIDRPNQV
jgi:putative transposase